MIFIIRNIILLLNLDKQYYYIYILKLIITFTTKTPWFTKTCPDNLLMVKN